MLVHVTPKIHLPHFADTITAELVEFHIPELNLHLKRGRDLVTRVASHDRNIQIASRIDAPRAIEGIVIDTQELVGTFTAVARWSLNRYSFVTHRTTYLLLDHEFDAATDHMAFWKSRWPEFHKGAMPGAREPRMDIWPGSMAGRARDGHVQDILGPDGFIAERCETFAIPTIEKHLLLASWNLHSRQEELDLISG